MNTYIPENHSRKEYLVGNSIHKEYSCSLNSFNLLDIYEVAFNQNLKAAIVLDETKLQTQEIQDFLKDFSNSQQEKTKIILLSENKISHKNIFCIPSSVYRPFNEYYRPRKISNNKFALCHLDTKNHKNNMIIQDIVYPNNKEIPIRLVGNPSIQHIQNLGVVTDDHMLDLIYSCSVYINISNEYIYDAILYQKPIISPIDNEYLLSVPNNPKLDQIKELLDKDTMEYKHNLSQYKISNIVKSIVKL